MATIAVVAAGAMGSAIGQQLVRRGCRVLTNLDGRSEATRKRAAQAGMIHSSYGDIWADADWMLSVLPPSEAYSLAQKVISSAKGIDRRAAGPLKFADCNAVNPVTVREIGKLFQDSPSFSFVDASIIGGPPAEGYDPAIYASTSDATLLNDFETLSKYGLRVIAMIDSNVGDASALKMSYAGITKGTTGLFTTMILAAYDCSPATADALMKELGASQPQLLRRITRTIPPMLPKAYRWVGEMEEIAGFVGGESGATYEGISKTYERVAASVETKGRDVEILKEFVEKANRDLICD